MIDSIGQTVELGDYVAYTSIRLNGSGSHEWFTTYGEVVFAGETVVHVGLEDDKTVKYSPDIIKITQQIEHAKKLNPENFL